MEKLQTNACYESLIFCWTMEIVMRVDIYLVIRDKDGRENGRMLQWLLSFRIEKECNGSLIGRTKSSEVGACELVKKWCCA